MAKHDPYEPRFHRSSKQWTKRIDGKLIYLGRDFAAAKHKLTKILAQGRQQGRGDWMDASWRELLEAYLDDLKARRAPATYASQVWRLGIARTILPESLMLRDLRKPHLATIEARLREENKSPTTIRDVLSAVQRSVLWAVEQDLVPPEANHLTGYRKPSARQRTRTHTDDEFQALLRCSPPSFRRFLVSLRLTGCRPGELRNLLWENVLIDQALWVLSEHKTRSTQQESVARFIPLPPTIVKLCRYLRHRAPEGEQHVFLNEHGKPYTKDRVVKLMDRARKRAGIKGHEPLVAYSHRHTFGTEAVGSVSDMELAQLMGHTDPRMTRRYVHMGIKNLQAARDRVSLGNAAKAKQKQKRDGRE